MTSHLAVQMFTLRDFTKTAADFEQTLRKVAEMGYPAVQISAVGCMSGPSPEVTASQARNLLDRYGLRCVATHRDWDSCINRTEEEIAFHQALGCDYIAIGAVPGPFLQKGSAGFRQMISESAGFIEKFRSAGIRWGYHDHHFEFIKGDDGKRYYDILLEEAPPEFCLEIDTYWAAHVGCCPAALIRKMPGRIPVVHFKDMEMVNGEGVVMAPVGEGNLEWDAIIPACQAGGTEWYCVEQDICRRDPFDCLRSSFEFLSSKGL